jgi:hypothetical protein
MCLSSEHCIQLLLFRTDPGGQADGVKKPRVVNEMKKIISNFLLHIFLLIIWMSIAELAIYYATFNYFSI